MINQPSRTLSLLTILGITLAIWLILYGLQLRFFGGFVSLYDALNLFTPPIAFVTWVGWLSAKVSMAALGWPLLVVGCSLLGSLAGLWLHQRWAPRSLLFFSAASLITFHWMNILSILLLILTTNKAIQQWLLTDPIDHG
jgi:hypothetical protein